MVGAAHVEEGFLLAGERRFRQVFCGGRRAHGDGDIGPAVAHALVACDDFLLQARGEGRGQDPAADARAGLGEARDVVDVERGELLLDAVREPFVRQEVAVGVGRGGEAVRHRDAERARFEIISPSDEFLPPTFGDLWRPRRAERDRIRTHERAPC